MKMPAAFMIEFEHKITHLRLLDNIPANHLRYELIDNVPFSPSLRKTKLLWPTSITASSC